MEEKFASINDGFGNCVFLNKSPKVVEGIIARKLKDQKIVLLSERPKGVKVENIDDSHDKLTLIYGEGQDVVGTITWRMASDGKCFVFDKFE